MIAANTLLAIFFGLIVLGLYRLFLLTVEVQVRRDALRDAVMTRLIQESRYDA